MIDCWFWVSLVPLGLVVVCFDGFWVSAGLGFPGVGLRVVLIVGFGVLGGSVT